MGRHPQGRPSHRHRKASSSKDPAADGALHFQLVPFFGFDECGGCRAKQLVNSAGVLENHEAETWNKAETQNHTFYLLRCPDPGDCEWLGSLSSWWHPCSALEGRDGSGWMKQHGWVLCCTQAFLTGAWSFTSQPKAPFNSGRGDSGRLGGSGFIPRMSSLKKYVCTLRRCAEPLICWVSSRCVSEYDEEMNQIYPNMSNCCIFFGVNSANIIIRSFLEHWSLLPLFQLSKALDNLIEELCEAFLLHVLQ